MLAYLAVLIAPTAPSWCSRGHARLGRAQGKLLIGCYAGLVALHAVRAQMSADSLVSSGGVGERWLGFGRGGARTPPTPRM